MDLTANLHFAFVEKNGRFGIQEQTPGGRVWPPYTLSSVGPNTDFAIVGRLLDSRTGQFVVIVAGIDGTGTQAAADFVSHPEVIEKGLRDAPADWQKKNLEVVLKTTITDSVAWPSASRGGLLLVDWILGHSISSVCGAIESGIPEMPILDGIPTGEDYLRCVVPNCNMASPSPADCADCDCLSGPCRRLYLPGKLPIQCPRHRV